MIKVKNVRHTGIVVDDLQKSLWFYQKKLGFEVSKRMEEKGDFIEGILGFDHLEITTVKLLLGNQMIELLDFGDFTGSIIKKNINDLGPTHLAFTVERLDLAFDELSSEGVEFISRPKISPDGLVKVAFCRAPEGTHIELVEMKE